ncbi:MAG: hypothetical protein KF800_19280 [Lysobacter sp.]|nr:hypothetical protein [Lysobacter sp.]
MRAAGMDLSAITPDALQAQRARLRSVSQMPAMPMFNNIALRREAGQSAEHFTDFMVDTRRALHTIDSRPVGHAMLSNLNTAPNPSMRDFRTRVTISDSRFTNAGMNPAAGNHARSEGFLHTREGLPVDSTPGMGEASRVYFNPTINHSDGFRPAFVGLAHELVHAERNQLGVSVDRQGGNGLRVVRDELETVGLLAHPQPTTENAIRAEHGIPLRTAYSGQTRATYMQAIRDALARRQGDGNGGTA